MKLFVPAETTSRETRVALTPATARKLQGLGLEIAVESGAGTLADIPDAAYTEAGCTISHSRSTALAEADILFGVLPPAQDDAAKLKKGALYAGFLDPFGNGELLEAFCQAGASAISLEFVPRTTLAQKMDGLSSQANLAGYYSMILAAERINRIAPMMMTPAGTLSPLKVFVIGVGVAGLQAIATARRLGARVTAFDTRPVVEEQVKSLGAKFLKIDLGDTGQTDQGYAKELTAEQIDKQRQGMAKACAEADIVITTAKLFGRPAPRIVTAGMVEGMQYGSIVVDLAADTGGNVEGSRPGEEILTDNGVRLIGGAQLERHVSRDASEMYASNLAALIEHIWDSENKRPKLDRTDAILKGCLLIHEGQRVHPQFGGPTQEAESTPPAATPTGAPPGPASEPEAPSEAAAEADTAGSPENEPATSGGTETPEAAHPESPKPGGDPTEKQS